MKSIVKTVIFCGQNNIPLRGKRDDNADDSNLHGNFQALLEFRIDSGDVKLEEHLENAPKNATYRSKTIQNEIIETVGNYICSKIIAEVKQTRMFSVTADEATDVSNKENLQFTSITCSRQKTVGWKIDFIPALSTLLLCLQSQSADLQCTQCTKLTPVFKSSTV